jgi:quinol monooxygenase YgiN
MRAAQLRSCHEDLKARPHLNLERLELLPWRKRKQSMIGVVIRAGVEPDQRHELMQMFKETSRTDQLPVGCLERRVYEEAHLPSNLLLVEQWSDKAAMNSYLSSDQFRALIGAVKVLGKLVDVRIFEANSIQNLLTKLKVEEC